MHLRTGNPSHISEHDYNAAVLRMVALGLEKFGIPYLLAYGTELGARRHGGFIPHDSDIDLFVRHADIRRIRELAEELRLATLYNYPPWGAATAFQKLLIPGAFDVDFFSEEFDELDSEQKALVTEGLNGRQARIGFCGMSLPVMEGERFLDIEYGPDWRVYVKRPGKEPVTLEAYREAHRDFRQPDMTRFDENRRCLVNGVFDVLHVGHINLLAKAKILFGYVIALVDSDDQVKIYKAGNTSQDHKTRMRNVASLHWVDRVIPSIAVRNSPVSSKALGGNPESALAYMEEIGADVMLCGYEEGYVDRYFATLDRAGRVFTTDRTPGISSSQIS